MHNVEHVLELVVGWLKEVRKLMEVIEVVEPVAEVVHTNLLRNPLRLAQLLTSRNSLHKLLREEEVVEEWLRIVTTKLQEEHLLVVDVVHRWGIIFVSGTTIVMNGTSPSEVSKSGILTPFSSYSFSLWWRCEKSAWAIEPFTGTWILISSSSTGNRSLSARIMNRRKWVGPSFSVHSGRTETCLCVSARDHCHSTETCFVAFQALE